MILTKSYLLSSVFLLISREGKTGDPIATELSERLKVTDSKSGSSTGGSIKGQLLHEAYQHIPSIRHLYMLYFVANKKNFEIAR